jgi:asparagine synthase (glutamine-hydrolysing)
MTGRLERRGPDGQGVEHDGAVTLGNRRLAILDLSDAGRQPMRSRDGRWLVTFNGEIYNYRDLCDELGVDRKSLRSTGDTEVLLLAWERWGPEALQRMVGQWAFAMVDTRESRLWLARDRFGEKPLYFHRGPDALAFASTLRALLAVPWVPRELDPAALAEFVTLRYVVSPRTVLAGIEKLPGGHLLEADADGARVRRWYEPRFRRTASRRRSDLVEEFGARLERATKRCLVSDVPVALLLSDGIDSRSIESTLSSLDQAVTSFTFRLSGKVTHPAPANGDEVELVVTPEERVEKMEPAFASLTEPVGDGASLATWFLIRHARQSATVFLCGHGGDEVLGGYRLSQDRFRLSALRTLAWLPKAWLDPIAERYLHGPEPPGARLDALRRTPRRKVPATARYLIHRPLPTADVEQLADAAPAPPGLAIVDELYAQCSEGAADLDRIQEVLLRTFLSENILSFADSVAMDSSAELRMPFLDRDLVEFALSLPPSGRVSRWPGRANTKQILRWWGREHLPREAVSRRKRTFNFGNLPELLRSHGSRVRGYVLDSSAVRKALPGVEAWVDHPPEFFRSTREGTLWALLALGIWCENAEVR